MRYTLPMATDIVQRYAEAHWRTVESILSQAAQRGENVTIFETPLDPPSYGYRLNWVFADGPSGPPGSHFYQVKPVVEEVWSRVFGPFT